MGPVGANIFRMEKVGEVSAATGGTFRLPEGGIVWVNPMHPDLAHYSISIRHYFQALWQADGPWFENRNFSGFWGQEPWVIAVDDAGKQAFALGSARFRSHDQRVMLGIAREWIINLGDARTPEEIARFEMLLHSRLYVFWPKMVSEMMQEIPPHK